MAQTSMAELIGTAALLLVVLGLGVAVFVAARNWRRRLDAADEREATIATYQNMLDEGLIDAQEFDRIQARLEGRLELPDTGGPSTGIRSGTPPQPTDYRPGPPPPPAKG